MKVEIWSDVICPWCGIGQHRLDMALAAFEHRDDVEVIHRSYELDPNASLTPRPAHAAIAAKYGMSDAQMTAMAERIEGVAAADGLAPYRVATNLTGNTRLVHEFLAFAADKGIADAAWKRLYRAYFGELRPIFDRASLVAFGVELGLDPAEVDLALQDGRYTAQVEADAAQAKAFGANGVPFVVIDRRFGVSGAQPVAVFAEALAEAWAERAATTRVVDEGVVCGPEGCEV